MSGIERDANGRALLGGTLLSELVTSAGCGTPAYVYDLDGIAAGARELERAFGGRPHVVAFALKANSAGSIVRTVAAEGAGADVVSGAELELALGCGIPADKIVMSGVGKRDDEIDLAIDRGILAIQAESVEEIERIAARARALGRRARLSLRINPGVEIDSHAHVATGHDAAKFGIARSDLGAAWAAVDRAAGALLGVGVSTHVGSMLNTVEPYLRSAEVVCDVALARRAGGAPLEFVDFGGGFAIDYGTSPSVAPPAFAAAALELLGQRGLGELRLIVEPGRAMVAAHGVLVSRVLQPKRGGERRWAVIDAGMNDLIRPALYGARHRIEPLERAPAGLVWRVVGPVCESADDFGEFALGEPVPEHVLIRDAGAYSFVMASTYNGRALPAEVFATGGRVKSVRAAGRPEAWVRDRLDA
jgi:diaminopimelate decarboxylase